jgi:hypothetical protein
VSDKKIIDLKDICEGLWEALRAVEYPHDLREVTKAELYTQCQELAECYKQLDARMVKLEHVLNAAESFTTKVLMYGFDSTKITDNQNFKYLVEAVKAARGADE